ncbi:MAG TPA: aldolase [Allosphingosinicella sp.]|jgi:serine kinase of HPr protein (carbohydrate metabolism regulator)
MTETIHAGCVAIAGRGVLISGASGRGKSDLALRLIDRGARLVSDDYTVLAERGGRLFASAPPRIAGRIEVRGLGIIAMEPLVDAPVCLAVDLDSAPERLPEPATASYLGLSLPSIAFAALEASAPIKLERALARFGLPLP